MSAWARQFLYVPPRDLGVGELRPSAKCSGADMDRWLDRLVEVDRLLKQGVDPQTFQQLRRHPAGSRQRQLGEAYHHFYDPRSHSRIRASWNSGRLEVDDGRHRVARARARDVAVLPVEVAAPHGAPTAALRRRYPPVDERHTRLRGASQTRIERESAPSRVERQRQRSER